MNHLILIPLFLIFVYLGLHLPTLNLDWMGITSHRSIITHSLFIPVLLLLIKSNVTKPIVAGLCIGVSIYLAMDMVSAFRGYALIHIPIFTQFSFGGWISLAWLGLNSALGLYLAVRLTTFHKLVVPSTFVFVSVVYAFYFHYSLIVLIPSLLVMVACYRKPLLT